MNAYLTTALADYLLVKKELNQKDATLDPSTVAALLLVAARLDQVRDQLNHGVTTFKPDF